MQIKSKVNIIENNLRKLINDTEMNSVISIYRLNHVT